MSGYFEQEKQFLVSGKYSIKDLIDIEKFRGILEKFSQATGFATGLFSYPKQELLISTGWRNVCKDFHCAVPVSEEICVKSNQKLASQLKKEKATCVDRCEHGLTDGATPIIIQGVHVASLFTGQVFFEKPDIEIFRKQAEQYGYDTDAYLEALSRVPIVTEDVLKKALGFLSEIAGLCAEQGLAEIHKREKTAALKASELLYRTTVDSLGEAVHLVDRNLHIAMTNKKFRQWCRQLGFGTDYFDKPLPEIFPFLAGKVSEQYNQVFETGQSLMTQEEYEFAGRSIASETQKIPIFDGDEIKNVLTVVRDDTERRQNEERLQESRANLKALIESTNDIIAAYDKDIRLITYNSACRKKYKSLFGVDLKIGLRTLELFPESTHDYWNQINKRALSGERFTDEIVLSVPNQGERVFESTYHPIFTETKITGFATFTRDITDRKKADEALRKNEARLCMAQQRAMLGCWDYEYATGKTWWSEQMFILFYRDPSEGPPGLEEYRTLIHPDDNRHLLEAYQQAVEKKSLLSVEFRTHPSRGPIRHLSVSGYSVDGEKDSASAMSGTVLDITERKKMEEERLILQRRKMKEKTQSLSRMAGAVAHHLNNMLAAMMGNIEMIRLELSETDRCDEYLDEAMKAAQRATELSGFMLAYTGQGRRKPEVLDLSSACDHIIPKIQDLKPEHVQMVTDFSSSGPVINADKVQVEQMLTHLVTNAWEAIGDCAGEVRISVLSLPAAEIPQSQIWPPDWKPITQELAVLQVTDTGCGICGEDLDKVMDPFFSTKFTGRGLGLAVVLGAIQSHKGAVVVKSEVGVGTTFQVLFSQADQKAVSSLKATPETTSSFEAGGLILLVEDEQIIRKVAAVMLKRLGFKVLIAEDGLQAVEMFREHKEEICLVISDLTMPNMNGWETLKALRGMKPDIPVILASGYDEARVMAGVNEDKPEVFLHKPYRMAALTEALKTALGKSYHPAK